ncbi:1-acyl-sn-glycerol-3-phosphate acyltransferase [Pedobacter alpinus]|uniref:1-acyl-sn-glycerol-3-phosphate acyltransferase n=1 Tax=Pedobacter alpinus TaxID=1590643 RepID=A0ABW5TP61_9SPHI
MKRRFNKLVINSVPKKENHSYLLMFNHFSFWDGLLAIYLCLSLKEKDDDLRSIHFMSLKKQMEKKPWLRYIGSFSVDPRKKSIKESLDFAAEILSKPGNVLVLYPQGNLESNHVRDIILQDGINQIVPKIAGNCQLVWSSNLVEYFESLKPTVYFHMMDAGTNHDYDFETLSAKINVHHKEAIKKQFRFTDN